MQDCELLNHPNVTGAGCPCGHIERTPVEPQPWPVPLATKTMRVIRMIEDDERDRRIASWWRTTNARRAS